MTRRPRTRAAVVLPLVAALLGGAGGAAYAVAQARATGVQGLTAAGFGAQASLSSGSGEPGSLVLTYSSVQDKDPRLFFLRNTRELALTGQTLRVSMVNTGGGTKGDATLSTCSVAFTSTGGCSGTETVFATVAEGTPVSVTTAFALAAGGSRQVKFQPLGSLRLFTVTFDVAVERAQARPATTSSS